MQNSASALFYAFLSWDQPELRYVFDVMGATLQTKQKRVESTKMTIMKKKEVIFIFMFWFLILNMYVTNINLLRNSYRYSNYEKFKISTRLNLWLISTIIAKRRWSYVIILINGVIIFYIP